MALTINLLITSCWLFMLLFQLRHRKYKNLNKEQLIFLPGYFLLETCKLEQKLAFIIQHLHRNFVLLEDVGWNYNQTKHKIAVKLGEVIIVLVVGCWIALFTKEYSLYLIVLIAALAIVFQLYHGTLQKVKQRRQQIILELPIVLTKMTLLIEAGETISSAFIRCMQDHSNAVHPLHKEWNRAIMMIKNGESFQHVIEKFSKRCSVQPISVLSTYLLLNYARGGSYFVTSIQQLMDELWDERKTIARKKGEEASSKLIFPTIFILLLLMILIVTPAIQLINFI